MWSTFSHFMVPCTKIELAFNSIPHLTLYLYIYNYIYIIWLDIIIQEINTRCYHYSSKMLIFYIYLGIAKPFTTARLISIFIHLHQTWARIYDIYALMATQKIPKSIPIRIKIIQNPSFCQVKFVVFILQWITIRLGWHQSERGSTPARRETGLKIVVRKVMGQRPNLKPFWQLNIFDDMWQTNAQFQLVPLPWEATPRFKPWHSTREPLRTMGSHTQYFWWSKKQNLPLLYRSFCHSLWQQTHQQNMFSKISAKTSSNDNQWYPFLP
jgi:hypothetical protein